MLTAFEPYELALLLPGTAALAAVALSRVLSGRAPALPALHVADRRMLGLPLATAMLLSAVMAPTDLVLASDVPSATTGAV